MHVILYVMPHVGYGAVRIGPLCFLAEVHKKYVKAGCSLFY